MKACKHLNNWLIRRRFQLRRALLLFLSLAPAIVLGNGTAGASSSAGEELGEILDRLINFSLGLLVLLAVAMIIYTAFLFATSGGDSEKFRTARRWLVYIVVGVAVGLLSKVFIAVVFEVAGQDIPDSL